MLTDSPAFSGFAVDDADRARAFYEDVLGLRVEASTEMGGLLTLHLGGGTNALVYPKADHQPATFTVLNFEVDDIDAAVDRLNANGIPTKIYSDDEWPSDERGIVRGAPELGPAIAWFRDPAGNVIAALSSASA